MVYLYEQLPDGQAIRLGDERFRCPELLFNPGLLGMDIDGIHESVAKCIRKCDIDIRAELQKNIILSGISLHFVQIGYEHRQGSVIFFPMKIEDPNEKQVFKRLQVTILIFPNLANQVCFSG